MKRIHFFLSFVLILSTNLLIASIPPPPTFGNPGPITICVNGSYYLNPSTTDGTFSSDNTAIATVNSSGYVTGVSVGTTIVSLVATGGGTVSAAVTVVASSSLNITDPLAQSSYKFNNNPQGPIGGTNNYLGYNGYYYSSQTRPISAGFYRASNQSGNEAGCPYEFNIFRCTTCEAVPDNASHSVGESYGGGIVAYILQAGDPGYDVNTQHGLIASSSDLSTGIWWYKGDFTNTTATGTAIGTGLANTNAIITNQGEVSTSYAAGLARAYTGGGHHDWYLPSIDELGKLFINKVAIGGFEPNRYWSSTEELGTNLDAKFQDFNLGDVDKNTKWFLYNVRAIRAF
jgi:hypothetical protein